MLKLAGSCAGETLVTLSSLSSCTAQNEILSNKTGFIFTLHAKTHRSTRAAFHYLLFSAVTSAARVTSSRLHITANQVAGLGRGEKMGPMPVLMRLQLLFFALFF